MVLERLRWPWPSGPVHDLEQRADQDLGQEQILMKVLGWPFGGTVQV